MRDLLPCPPCGRQGRPGQGFLAGSNTKEPRGSAPPRARPQRRGSPGPIPNPAVKPAFAESTAAQGCGRAGRRARGGRFSNMSRTLSIDNIGPGLDSFEPGSGPFSISPSCGDLGVSLRRSSSQFNIRPRRISALDNPLLRLGLPRRNDSLCTRVAPAALAKEKTGVRPNGLGSDHRMGWIALCRDGLPEG